MFLWTELHEWVCGFRNHATAVNCRIFFAVIVTWTLVWVTPYIVVILLWFKQNI